MDEHLLDMSAKIGELTGKIDTFIENQTSVNKSLTAVIQKMDEKHGGDISDLKASRSKLIGVAIGSGIASSSLMTSIMKFIGGGH